MRLLIPCSNKKRRVPPPQDFIVCSMKSRGRAWHEFRPDMVNGTKAGWNKSVQTHRPFEV